MGEKRDAYLDRLTTRLGEWEAEIDRLQERADRIRTPSRTEYQNQIEALRERRDQVEQEIRRMREAAEGSWRGLKSEADRARKAMDKALRTAASRFR